MSKAGRKRRTPPLFVRPVTRVPKSPPQCRLVNTPSSLRAGFYGASALDPTNYSRTRLLTDRTLTAQRERYRKALGLCVVGTRRVKRQGKRRCGGAGGTGGGAAARRAGREFVLEEAAADDDGGESGDDDDDAEAEENFGDLYGDGAEDENGELQLLYALTERNKGARIRNLLQLSAAILAESKVLFFSKLHWMLTVADPSKLQLAYCDTDSLVFTAVSPRFSDCVLPEMRERYEREKHEIFADPLSPVSQNGLLKEEFIVSPPFSSALHPTSLPRQPPIFTFAGRPDAGAGGQDVPHGGQHGGPREAGQG